MWNFLGTTDIQLEALRLEPMASGDESILLSERVVWEEFPAYASALAGLVGGRIIDEADSAAERVWTVSIGGQRFFLAYDDYPSGVGLEPQDRGAAALIPTILQRLLRVRGHNRSG